MIESFKKMTFFYEEQNCPISLSSSNGIFEDEQGTKIYQPGFFRVIQPGFKKSSTRAEIMAIGYFSIYRNNIIVTCSYFNPGLYFVWICIVRTNR